MGLRNLEWNPRCVAFSTTDIRVVKSPQGDTVCMRQDNQNIRCDKLFGAMNYFWNFLLTIFGPQLT